MPKYRIKVEDVTNPQSVKTVYTHEVEADVDKLRAFAAGVNGLVNEAKVPKQKPKP